MGGAIQEGVTSLIRRIASEIVEYLFFLPTVANGTLFLHRAMILRTVNEHD